MLWLWIIVGVVVLLILASIFIYNDLVSKRLKVENNFSQIDIQCKKRFDLVPNLVEVVKGYAKHEKETLEKVISARNSGFSANNLQELENANNEVSKTLGKIFALAEGYPSLKASDNFKQLQEELVNIEKTIALSRGFYNDAVMMYNRVIKTFPSNIVAAMFNFKETEFFDVPKNEKKNVKLKLK